MKMLDINGNLVRVDVREASFPMKAKSKSILQGLVGQKLRELYPSSVILEEFFIPGHGCRLSVDFFLPGRGIVIECQSSIHEKFSPFHHGQRTASTFHKQVRNDSVKSAWAENNGFQFIEIWSEKDIKTLSENR